MGGSVAGNGLCVCIFVVALFVYFCCCVVCVFLCACLRFLTGARRAQKRASCSVDIARGACGGVLGTSRLARLAKKRGERRVAERA